MDTKINDIIVQTLLEINEEIENENLVTITLKTKIFGANGALDSLALVSFIVDLEERISDEFSKNIVLADEKAMSQKTSPFRDVASLTTYIAKLLRE